MANIIDKFLSSMKLNEDEYEEEDEFALDDELEAEAESEDLRSSSKRKTSSARATGTTDEDFSARPTTAESTRSTRSRKNNVVSMDTKRRSSMEVCMVKPASIDDAKEVCDILLSGRVVVINMEGVHVNLAQRIVDFTSGACYSMNGNLQSISKYIFIVTPSNIELSGDFQEVFNVNESGGMNLNL